MFSEKGTLTEGRMLRFNVRVMLRNKCISGKKEYIVMLTIDEQFSTK